MEINKLRIDDKWYYVENENTVMFHGNKVDKIIEKSNLFYIHVNNDVFAIKATDYTAFYVINNEGKRSKKEQVDYSDDVVELTNRFLELIQFNNPKFKIPNDLSKWHDSIEKMMRLDNLSFDEVKMIIEYAQTDNFWKPIVLSAEKLRQKKDTLLMQVHRKNGTGLNKLRQIAEGGNDEPTGSSKGHFFTFD
jgi:hypothetical protein